MNADTNAKVDRLRALEDDFTFGDVIGVLGVFKPCASHTTLFRDSIIDLLEKSDPTDWTDEMLREYGLARLPRDKNGVIIHVGDTVWSEDGREWTVDHTCIGSMQYSVFVVVNTGNSIVYAQDPNTLTHHSPITVESLLREFGDKYIQVVESPNPIVGFGNEIIGEEDPEKTIAEYAKRLQLAEVDDDN